jgi:4-hydroxy-tetrahydrodipicolinate synthase
MLKGSIAALVTPFLPGGEIDFECYGRIIDFHAANGTAGIVVLGTTGEAPAIKEDEREALIAFAVQHTAGRMPVIVGCSGGDTAHARERCADAERLGADAVLLLTPYYNKANSRGMVEHFRLCAESTGLPLIMYNVPGRTGCSLTLAEIAELKKIPNIAGIKEASGNMGFFARVCTLADDSFAVYCGCDEMNVPALAAGAAGLVSVLANVLPRECALMCEYMEKGELAEARAIQHRYSALTAALFSEPNPIPVKTAMNALCIGGVGEVGGFRLPLCEMGEGNKRALLKALAECRMKSAE